MNIAADYISDQMCYLNVLNDWVIYEMNKADASDTETIEFTLVYDDLIKKESERLKKELEELEM